MKKAISIIVIIAIIAAGIGVYFNRAKIAMFLMPKDEQDGLSEESEPEINVDYISKKIEKISSLQTAKITYGCMVDFSEGSGFLVGKSFSMFYEAEAYAGIDVSGINVSKENEKFIIQLPASIIEEKPKIDPESFVFYDKKNGLLNHLAPEDTGKALEYAQSDVYYQATTDQLLELADSNAVTVIKSLLLSFLDEEDFEIRTGERASVSKIKPPISSEDAIKEYNGKKLNQTDLEKKFKEAGFTNIKLDSIEDLNIGFFVKEGSVESISIDGKDSFKKSSIFDSNAEVVIKYHAKKSK